MKKTPLRKLYFGFLGFAGKYPRLQRVLCKVGAHTRTARMIEITWDGAIVWQCRCCEQRFERPGF